MSDRSEQFICGKSFPRTKHFGLFRLNCLPACQHVRRPKISSSLWTIQVLQFPSVRMIMDVCMVVSWLCQFVLSVLSHCWSVCPSAGRAGSRLVSGCSTTFSLNRRCEAIWHIWMAIRYYQNFRTPKSLKLVQNPPLPTLSNVNARLLLLRKT